MPGIEILAHRGIWNKKLKKNSLDALTLALDMGFGIETDIRDRNGVLVISHDMANETDILLDDLFK